MNLRYILLLFVFFCFTKHSIAQKQDKNPFALSISYFGNNIFRPGLKLAIHPFPWGNPAVEERPKRFQFLHTTSIGFFSTPKTNTSIFATTEPGMRLSTRGGFRFEGFLGAGYMRIFNSGTTYEVSETGIEKVPLASRGYFLAHLTLGIGKDLYPKRGLPMAWYIRPSFYLLTPYNAGINVLVNFELGVTYHFNVPKRKEQNDDNLN